MDYTNLQVLAEVSVTLLGFSGLTAVIGHSRFDQRGIAFRMRGLLYTSSVAFIGSIMPLVGVPILLAAIGVAASMSMSTVRSGQGIFGWFGQKVQLNLALAWILFSIWAMFTLYLWWSIFTLAEQLQFIYELSIGVNLLFATFYFVRLVRSAFFTKDMSGND